MALGQRGGKGSLRLEWLRDRTRLQRRGSASSALLWLFAAAAAVASLDFIDAAAAASLDFIDAAAAAADHEGKSLYAHGACAPATAGTTARRACARAALQTTLRRR